MLTCVLAGCSGPHGAVHYLGDADLSYYKDRATEIAYPVLDAEVSHSNLATDEPRRLRRPRKDALWDLSLQEAIQIALENNPVLRNRAQFLRPTAVPLADSASTFDPAIQETEVLFGQQGPEAALSEFDAQFTTSILWGRDERVQNNPFQAGGLPAGSTLQEDTALFQSRLQKQMATGGRFAINHTWDYSWNNAPSRLFPSAYVGELELEYRHPLWAGAGTEFTRIAGPVFDRDPFRSTTGLDRGVVVARIRTDISLAEFEANVRNLVKDVEDLYWELALAYRVFDAEVQARNSSLRTWREIKSRAVAGLAGGGAADEAQARDNFYENRARVESALADLYQTEGQLRRLLGLAVNDGRIIRPVDEPLTAEFVPDWQASLCEALVRRVELRRQKWTIKSLELQTRAAESLTQPRLDFVSRYRVNAFGDQLLGEDDDDGVTEQGLRSGYETLTQGDQTGWNLGLEFSMPVGFRSAHAQLRNLQLKLARARAVLATQELDISHELSSAFQSLDRWYVTAQTNFQRRQAAVERVQAFEAEYEAQRLQSVDLLLRAQISLAQAEIAYYRSLVEYSKAISELHFRKGTLLEFNNIALSEGAWTPEAYEQALDRAWARSHALPNECLDTEPAEFELLGAGTPLAGATMAGSHSLIPPAGAVDELAPPPAPAAQPQELPPKDAAPVPVPPTRSDEARADTAPTAADASTRPQPRLTPQPRSMVTTEGRTR